MDALGPEATHAPGHLDTHGPVDAPRRHSRVLVGLAAVAVGAGALGITSIASAASSGTPAPTTTGKAAPQGVPAPGSDQPGDGDRRGRGMGGPGGMGGMGGMGGPGGMHAGGFGMRGAVHGEFVVPKTGGGYQTVDMQAGVVTVASTSSLTVKSADGFTKSYAVSAATLVNAARDGIGSVAVGDEVRVSASVAGSEATAVDMMDITKLKAAGAKWGFGPGPGDEKAPTAAASTASAQT